MTHRTQKEKVLLDFFLVRATHRPCVCGARRAFSAIAAVRFLAIHPVWQETAPCSDEKFLADHSCQRAAGSPNRGVQGAAPLVARRSGRNTPIVPKRHPQMAQSPAKPKAAVPTPSRVVDGGLIVHPTVGRGIPDAPAPHPIRGRQGCRPLRFACSVVHPGGGGKPPPYRVEPIGI